MFSKFSLVIVTFLSLSMTTFVCASSMFRVSSLEAVTEENYDALDPKKSWKEAQRVFKSVINTGKLVEDMNSEEKAFIKRYKIDTSRPIQYIAYAFQVIDLKDNKILEEDSITKIIYFPDDVSIGNLRIKKRNLRSSIKGNLYHHVNYHSLSFEIKNSSPLIKEKKTVLSHFR